MPFPGLTIEGVGCVALPITPAQLEAIKTAATQAPFGKGSTTVVDMSVRNSLQIDAKKVTMKNPAWEGALESLVHEIAIKLGLDGSGITCELYKLLLYELGGHFKRHHDSEKVEGMFGTLVVQLPSIFAGGAYRIRHAGIERVFALGGTEPPAAAHGFHYVAHYADCDHEVEPLTSGLRLAAVYSLRWTASGAPPPPPCMDAAVRLAARLASLDTCYGLLLEHAYTEASLLGVGMRALKGRDRAAAASLACASALMAQGPTGRGLALFLARAERIIVDHDDYGCYCLNAEDAPALSLAPGSTLNLDGTVASTEAVAMLRGLDLYRDIVNADPAESEYGAELQEWWKDRSGEGVYIVGNEGVQPPQTYSCYVLCFCPAPTPDAPLAPRPAPPPKLIRTRIGLGRFGGPEWAYKPPS